MGRVRLALVGLGAIGLAAHLPALLRSEAVTVRALVDPIAERREQARALAAAPIASYADCAELPADVDGFVLATPPWVTTGLARQLLADGRFVLAEKPIATSVQAAAPLLDLPATAVQRLQVGLTYRHDPALDQLRRWIADGPLDGPLLIRAHVYDERLDPADPEHAALIRTTLAHGPPVVHEGAHVFDWLAYLLGGPPEQVADAWAIRTDGGAQDGTPNLIGARLSYSAGRTALCEFGWLTDQLPRCELTVLGQHGYAVLDGFTFDLSLRTNAGTEVFQLPADLPADRTIRCFDRQLERFVALIRGTAGTGMPGLAEGLAALEIGERVAKLAKGAGV